MTTTQRRSAAFIVAAKSGQSAVLRVDPTRQGVSVSGPDPLASQVLRLVAAQDASRETPQAPGDLFVVGAPEVVDDLGLGALLDRVPDILGELEVARVEPSARFWRDWRRYMCPMVALRKLPYQR